MRNRPGRLFLAATLWFGVVAVAQEEEAAESPYELLSVARFGERAVAVIGIEGGARKVLRLGQDLGRTGYVLSEVDVKYVELKRGDEVMTLTLDNADEASIARRKAARAAQEAKADAEPEPEPNAANEADAEVDPQASMKAKLNQTIAGEWALENADVNEIAKQLRAWTKGEDGKSVRVRVLTHRNANEALVTASGTGTKVIDALNMFAKEFSVPYVATHDGTVLLGSGYFFRKERVGLNDDVEAIADRHDVDRDLVRGINPKDPKAGSFIIVPVPVTP